MPKREFEWKNKIVLKLFCVSSSAVGTRSLSALLTVQRRTKKLPQFVCPAFFYFLCIITVSIYRKYIPKDIVSVKCVKCAGENAEILGKLLVLVNPNFSAFLRTTWLQAVKFRGEIHCLLAAEKIMCVSFFFLFRRLFVQPDQIEASKQVASAQ